MRRKDEEQWTLLATYLDNVIAATVDQASHLFGWVKRDVERAAAQLAEAGRIATEMRVEGLREASGTGQSVGRDIDNKRLQSCRRLCVVLSLSSAVEPSGGPHLAAYPG